jgi:organic hydroperoxide reductase OsmC/OhrA
MLKSYSCRIRVNWTQHKRGIVETINFATPAEFDGEPGLWTPEHLLWASAGTCYVATPQAVAEASKLGFDAVEVSVEGKIEKLEGGLKFTKITLRPVVNRHREDDRERTGRVIEKSEQVFRVSRSLDCR